jgi:hypothetical protein
MKDCCRNLHDDDRVVARILSALDPLSDRQFAL